MLPNNAKPHPQLNGLYITECGRVFSTLSHKIKELSQFRLNKKVEYLLVGGKHRRYVHRLVAETYLPNPHNLTDVNHINGDKTDNSVSNLEWCSRVDNMRHAWDNGYFDSPRYSYKIMVISTGEIFDTSHINGVAHAFSVNPKVLGGSYKFSKTTLPVKVISRKKIT